MTAIGSLLTRRSTLNFDWLGYKQAIPDVECAILEFKIRF